MGTRVNTNVREQRDVCLGSQKRRTAGSRAGGLHRELSDALAADTNRIINYSNCTKSVSAAANDASSFRKGKNTIIKS